MPGEWEGKGGNWDKTGLGGKIRVEILQMGKAPEIRRAGRKKGDGDKKKN